MKRTSRFSAGSKNAFLLTIGVLLAALVIASVANMATGATTVVNVTTLAGLAGTSGTASSSSVTTSVARFNNPSNSAYDSSGNLFVADMQNECIRKIDTAGNVTIFAGSTTRTSGRANGTGTAAQFHDPSDIAIDGSNNLYVADSANNEIRKITPAGVVTLFAGNAGGSSGQTNGAGSGNLTTSYFDTPSALAFDPAHATLYIADTGNDDLRKIVMSTSTVSTFVNGSNEQFMGVAADGSGNVFAAQTGRNRIREYDSSGNTVTTWGSPSAGSADGNDTSASMRAPEGIAIDATYIYFADTGNSTIRRAQIASPFAVTTLAGLAQSTGTANGSGATARFNQPTGVALNGANVVVADNNNHALRNLNITTDYTISPSAGANGSISPNTTQNVASGSSSATFTITPNTGYHIASVLVDGSSVGAVAAYKFTNVTADHTISATFAIDTFTLAPTAGANGTISPSTTQTVNYGGSQTFAVAGNAHYHIADVLKDGVSIGASSSVTFSNVSANHTLSATFAIDTFTLAPTAGANGTISPSTTQTVNYGGSQTFAVAGNAHYHIADVLKDGVSIGASSSVTFSNVSANHTLSATFAIDTNTITVGTPVHGSISPSGNQSVAYGSDITFGVAADPHYHIADVLKDGVSIGASSSVTFSNVTAPHTLSATFAIDTFEVVPTAGAHGTITPDTTQTVDYGGSATFAIAPDTGYHIADVLVDEVSVGASSSVTFSDVTAGHTISATFAIDTFDLVPSAGAHGTITPDTTQTVDYGGSATFAIAPDTGYHIADVLVDEVSVGASSSVTFSDVTASHTVSATFAVDTFEVVPTVIGGGTISPDTTQTVDYGSSSETFTIAPDVGHHLIDVLVDGVSQGVIAEYKFADVTTDHTIVAVFAIDTFHLVPSAGAHGTITPDTTQTVDYGGSATFAIAPDTGYHIADVLVDEVSVGASSSVTFNDVTAGHTVSATFAIDTFDLVPSAGAHGTIRPSTTQTVDYGGSATFAIAPDTGYHIADVLVDDVSVGASSSVTFSDVTAGHTVSAAFAIDTFDIVPTGGPRGTITPSTTQTVDYGGAATFAIAPDTGYHIADVLVDEVSVGASSSVTFSDVQAGHTVSATFAIDTFDLVPSAGTHGSITPDTTQTVDYGGSATFAIAPDTGYHIADVLVDAVSVGASSSVTFADVHAGHTVSATFAIDTFDLVPSAGAHGTITPSTAQTVDYGGSATFAIAPDTGYHIADVLVDEVSVGASSSVTFSDVTAGHTVSATFAIDSFTVAPSAGPHGSVSPNTTQTVAYGGSSPVFQFTPDVGYHVADVLVDGVSQGPSASLALNDVTQNHEISATFAIDTFDLVPSASANGAISPSTAQTVDYGSDSATFTMTPDSGYHVADVLVDSVSQGAIAEYKFTNVTADHTISVSFAADTAAKTVIRLSGGNRFATAVALGKQAFPDWTGVRDLVLASGDNAHQPDALTAAGLAGAYNGPLLLAPTKALDGDTRAAITAMPSGLRVHIVGGTSAISDNVLNQVKRISKVTSVDRVSGNNRFATGAAVAQKMKTVLGASMPETVLLANGASNSFMLDPLIASTASVSKHFPVLLLDRTSVPTPTRNAITSLGLSTRYIVGGTGAVSDSVRTSLSIPAGNRIAGADVRGDAVAFATKAKAAGWLTGNWVGFGASVPDAATGGAYMGKEGGPILIVSQNSVPTVTSNYLSATKASIDGGYLCGGPNAATEGVRLSLIGFIN